MNEELKHIFTPGPTVSFRSSKKINSYLVRATLYLVERSLGSFNCKRPHCQICTCVKYALEVCLENICTIRSKHKRKCVVVSLLICIYMNWYCLRSCCCSYAYCLPLLVTCFIVGFMETIVVI